jgi:hypothetical protein
VQGSSLNLLTIAGEDGVAEQLCITIIPPMVVPSAQFPGGVVPADGSIQNATGERDNYSLYRNPNPIANFSWMQAVAFVEWGIGGVQSKVECDCLNGLVLNLCASFVRVSAFVDAVKMDGEFVSGGALVLGAYVGPGFPRANNAQRTFNVGEVQGSAGGGTQFPSKGFGNPFNTDPTNPPLNGMHNAYPVPFHAKQAFICVVGNPTVDVWDMSIQFYRDVHTSIPLSSYRFTQDSHQPVRIPNGAYYWTLHNHQVHASQASVVFDLSV